MPLESTQEKVRPHRVKITYNVDSGNATVLKEIPFVMGIMADLSGDRGKELPEISERDFTPVDAFTFDSFLKEQAPRLVFDVESVATAGAKLPVELTLEKLADFSPALVAQRVPGLSELYQTRQALASLLTKIESKPRLEKALDAVLTNPRIAQAIRDTAAARNKEGTP